MKSELITLGVKQDLWLTFHAKDGFYWGNTYPVPHYIRFCENMNGLIEKELSKEI